MGRKQASVCRPMKIVGQEDCVGRYNGVMCHLGHDKRVGEHGAR